MRDIILQHADKYPLMEPVDYIKLIYHSEFGGGHMIWDEEQAKIRMADELRALPAKCPKRPIFEFVGCNMYRMNLTHELLNALSDTTIARMFIHTGEMRRGSDERFQKKLALLLSLARSKEIFVDADEMAQFLTVYANRGYEPVHHSEAYRSAYHPCYRLVSGMYKQYYDVILRVEKLMRSRRSHVTVAIDGPTGAGKSTLAALLKSLFDCNVFHLDDFRLPPDRITGIAPAEAVCADLDVARFDREVSRCLGATLPFSYHRFDGTMNLSRTTYVYPRKLNIIEGTYAMYPKWAGQSQLKIFLNITPEKQKKRLKNNPLSAAQAEAEQNYFSLFCIREKADIRLITK